MARNIFDLVYTDFDFKEHFFFEGPDGANLEDFEKLCNNLIPRAGYQAIVRFSSEENRKIYWHDVVESLVSLLEMQGYQRVFLNSFHVKGSGIFGPDYDGELSDERLGFSGRMIVNHNRKIEEKLDKEREAKRILRGIRAKKVPIQIIK